MYRTMIMLGLGLLVGCSDTSAPPPVAASEDKPAKLGSPPETKDVANILRFTMKNIDEELVPLTKYRNKVLLIVNVASQCGYTKQYKQLQALHETYASRGLSILGVPANDFGQQEPGANEQIKAFATDNYNVSFDMFAKTVVKGSEQCPLYAALTSEGEKAPGEVKWNFEKFLIGRDGNILARFRSKVEPQSEEMIKAIEDALGAT